MSRFDASAQLGNIKGRVIVVAGGANGIGAAFVETCEKLGATVYFGDVDDQAGKALEQTLAGRATFIHTDVSDYQSQLRLFRTALTKSGCIDTAVCCAGIQEIGNWFDPQLSLNDVREAPTSKVIDVNLLGSLYFSRIAAVYLRWGQACSRDKSIALISSVAGFKDAPGIFVYQAAKHGVLGLMRSLRSYLPDSGIRINVVCPWMTRTVMTRGIERSWDAAHLPVNEASDVARVIAEICASAGLNGKAMYVEGGRAWEIEDNLNRLEPQWLGEEPSKSLNRGQEVLGKGEEWSRGAKL